MKILGPVLGLLLSWVVAVEDYMPIIPIKRTTLKPRTYIKTRYGSMVKDHYVNTQMFFNTSKPALHLDNFVQIIHIKCNNETISLTFDTTSNAIDAFTEWSSHPDLTVMMSHERKCNGNQVGTFDVSQMTLSKQYINIIIDRSLDRKDVVTDWHVVIDQYAVGRKEHNDILPIRSNNNLKKRDLFGSRMVSRIGEKLFGDNAMHWNSSTTLQNGFNSNYNETTQTVINPNIEIFEFMEGAAHCINCYTTGHAALTFEFSGSLALITKYKVTSVGGLKANFDLQLLARTQWSTPLLTLFEYDLLPINIPGIMYFYSGVISFAPQFRVQYGIALEIRGELGTTFGFDFNLPMNFTLESTNGMLSLPTFTSTGKPTFNPHIISNLITGGKAMFGAHFEPDINWGFDPLAYKDENKDATKKTEKEKKDELEKEMADIAKAEKSKAGAISSGGESGDTAKEKTLGINIGLHFGTPADTVNEVPKKRTGIGMKLSFDNGLEVTLFLGNMTRCKDHMEVMLYQDHTVKFKIMTTFVSKRWYLWRFRNVLKCWFCDDCGVGINGKTLLPTTTIVPQATSATVLPTSPALLLSSLVVPLLPTPPSVVRTDPPTVSLAMPLMETVLASSPTPIVFNTIIPSASPLSLSTPLIDSTDPISLSLAPSLAQSNMQRPLSSQLPLEQIANPQIVLPPANPLEPSQLVTHNTLSPTTLPTVNTNPLVALGTQALANP